MRILVLLAPGHLAARVVLAAAPVLSARRLGQPIADLMVLQMVTAAIFIFSVAVAAHYPDRMLHVTLVTAGFCTVAELALFVPMAGSDVVGRKWQAILSGGSATGLAMALCIGSIGV